MVVCSSYAFVNELCDETRFIKDPQGTLAVSGPASISHSHVRRGTDSKPGIGSEEWRTRWTLHSKSRQLRGPMEADAPNIAIGQAQ